MKPFRMQCKAFSPRWGREDRYEMDFSDAGLVVSLTSAIRKATLTHKPGEDPEWVGTVRGFEHPLLAIFQNDGIYPPTVVPFASEWAFRKWRDGAMEEDVKNGVLELFNWISTTARSSPSHPFWQGSF